MVAAKRSLCACLCFLLLMGVCGTAHAADSGSCGDNLTWSLDDDGILTISGSGAMTDWSSYRNTPWYSHASEIRAAVLEEGVTTIGKYAFGWTRNLTAVVLPAGFEKLSAYAFSSCGNLDHIFWQGSESEKSELTLQSSGNTILNSALWHYDAAGTELYYRRTCESSGLFCRICQEYLTEESGTGTHSYSDDTDLTCDICGAARQLTGLSIASLPETLVYRIFTEAPDTTGGTISLTWADGTAQTLPLQPEMLSGFDGTRLGQQTITISLGECSASFDVEVVPGTPDALTIAAPAQKTDYLVNESLDLTGLSLCASYGEHGTIRLPLSWAAVSQVDLSSPGTRTVTLTVGEAAVCFDITVASPETIPENRLILGDDFSDLSSVWIDGVEFSIQTDDTTRYIDLPDGNARILAVHRQYIGDCADVHSQYPVGMQIWTLQQENGAYCATRQEALDDLLGYSGMSIRVTGRKGIRMISSVPQASKDALTGEGLAGFTLEEYGTAVAWSSTVNQGRALILGKSYVVSNYAYKRNVADPVFDSGDGLMHYTNVLVNFTLDQCRQDLAMRPYMILRDSDGQKVTVYGGIVHRSIGYIAYQNRNYFEPGTEEYEYVWEIIHHVYGTLYDDDYQTAWTPPSM